ncbi:bifunctional methylenetetrahydrofolate dehydrogenase/methenyltetrahydrofolate cyclohydrolase [Bordetella genomosp. 9]|uniref:Bifunctional protein FolD n=1 Tax=Bordetella genomosp. 9 TaxID=1416803 RepID=A0A261RNZ0_9BORD|nr:bifunctional methylenetetrahydrofolate dehydrogenase/methenyltetrahydrofolate cyclohydrolase FolD [Bordetella genomosp. 9]OZI26774.1 bifunctional methylenetetrahydrofolate dehydrogenase/methenyltetrahydrofolate cyclohydrolase [Bordetella genomosp. 9]
MKTAPSSSKARAAQALNGTEAAAEVIADVARQMRRSGVVPKLAVVLVGEDPASMVYVANKARQAERIGYASLQVRLPARTSDAELAAVICGLNDDASVHGILVQLPLPPHLSAEAVACQIAPDKDVDGFHEVNVGRMTLRSSRSAFVPCTPLGCMHLIHQAIGHDLKGLNAVVIGKSNIVGRPMATLLMHAECTVSVAHIHTRDIEQLCRTADILVVAAGSPGLVRGDWIKPGAVVIDVGINRVDGEGGRKRLAGDVAYDEAAEIASFITPVPGGVGPMTIAMLMKNTYTAAVLAEQARMQTRAVPVTGSNGR